MKKLIVAFALFVSLSANASIISIDISDPSVSVGEKISVSLIASGFEDFDTFDLDFDFDTSVFSYDPSSLVSDLITGFTFEVNQVPDGMALSLFNFTAFNGDFLLASFDLIAISEGITQFTFSDALFSDTFVETVLVVDISDSDLAEVVAAEVSAPATIGMFAGLLLAVVALRRRSLNA
jgi:hypothetical protein